MKSLAAAVASPPLGLPWFETGSPLTTAGVVEAPVVMGLLTTNVAPGSLVIKPLDVGETTSSEELSEAGLGDPRLVCNSGEGNDEVGVGEAVGANCEYTTCGDSSAASVVGTGDGVNDEAENGTRLAEPVKPDSASSILVTGRQ